MFLIRRLLLIISLAVISVCSFSKSNPSIDAAQKAVSKIETKNAYVDDLLKALSTRVSLPVGVKRTISNNEVIIAIDKVKFRKDYTEFSAFVKITTSLKDKAGEDVVLFLVLRAYIF